MKVWSAYLNEAIEVESVTPERIVDEPVPHENGEDDEVGQ